MGSELGTKNGGVQHVAKVDGLVGLHGAQDVLVVGDAQDLVQLVLVHGQAREAALDEVPQDVVGSDSTSMAWISVRGTITARTGVSAKSKTLWISSFSSRRRSPWPCLRG